MASKITWDYLDGGHIGFSRWLSAKFVFIDTQISPNFIARLLSQILVTLILRDFFVCSANYTSF